MHSQNHSLEHFFRAFEHNTSTGDMQAAADQFADVFLAAGPAGAKAVRASEFAMALPRRKELFDRLGCRSTALASLVEAELSPRYAMATTEWRMSFARPGMEDKEIVASSIFIVDTGTDPCKVVFYLACQDLLEILRQAGIAAG